MQGQLKISFKDEIVQKSEPCKFCLSKNMFACLQIFGVVGMPRVAIIRGLMDQWIPGHFGNSDFDAHARPTQSLC
jgi:hypothetical protein